MSQNILKNIYNLLYKSFGPQHWWPGDFSFEIIIGAILTQNTNWSNVEKALNNLKSKNLLNAEKMWSLDPQELAQLIRPAGYYNIKTKRIRNFLQFFLEKYSGDVSFLKSQDLQQLREEMLFIKGIGPETADSILLYALDKPIFVVDAYTKRIFSRHNLVGEEDGYYEIQNLFIDSLEEDIQLFNEYHALIVKCAKEYCKNKNPKCDICPLNGINW